MTFTDVNSNVPWVIEMFVFAADCLQKYHESCNRYPGTVLVYRDGVGEGQIDYVKDIEVPAIQVRSRSVLQY